MNRLPAHMVEGGHHLRKAPTPHPRTAVVWVTMCGDHSYRVKTHVRWAQLQIEWPCVASITAMWVAMCGEHGCSQWSCVAKLQSERPWVVSTATVAMCGEHSYRVSGEHSCRVNGHVWWAQQLQSEWPCVVSTAAEWVAMCGEYSCRVNGHVVSMAQSEWPCSKHSYRVSGHVWWAQLQSEWPCVVSTAQPLMGPPVKCPTPCTSVGQDNPNKLDLDKMWRWVMDGWRQFRSFLSFERVGNKNKACHLVAITGTIILVHPEPSQVPGTHKERAPVDQCLK